MSRSRVPARASRGRTLVVGARAGAVRARAGAVRARAGAIRARAGAVRVPVGAIRVRVGAVRVPVPSRRPPSESPRTPFSAHRLPILLTGALAAVLLAGCGVTPTGVVEAGEPATGMPADLRLYFTDAGRLVGVPRQVNGDPDAATAVRLLFAGPTEDESGRLGTALPEPAVPPKVTVAGDTVDVVLPQGIDGLGTTARQQLVCTLAGLPFPKEEGARPHLTGLPENRPRRQVVRVVGSGWETVLGARTCPFFWD